MNNNINIERAILSAIVFEPKMIETIKTKLQGEDFYLPFHKNIFNTMKDLDADGKPIDEEFIKNRMEKAGTFDETQMLDLLSANPIANTDAYIDRLKKDRAEREMKHALNMAKIKHDEGESVESIIQYLTDVKDQVVAYKKPIIDLDPLSCVQDEEVHFLTKWLPVPQKGVTLITAAGGSGKSFITLQLLLRYLGLNPNKKAFAWLSEDMEGLTKIRASKICKNILETDDEALDRLIVVGANTGAKLFYTGEEGITDTFRQVRTLLKDFDIIVLDPLIAFFGGEENSNTQARQFMEEIKTWAVQENKAIVIIHHSAKASKGETQGSRGASAFVDASRLTYSISKHDPEGNPAEDRNVVVTIIKDNYGAKGITGESFEREIFPDQLLLRSNSDSSKGGENVRNRQLT